MDAWVLNLDADLELGTAGAYAPSRAVLSQVRAARAPLIGSLVGEGDVVVDETTANAVARGLRGRAFCPTPRALALLARAGALPDEAPPVDVLRRVNSRAFASAMTAGRDDDLPGALFATDEATALAQLATRPAGFAAWRVKRAFGMAGRGQRVVRPGDLSRADRELVRAAVATGGVVVEPQVEIEEELAVHGLVEKDGAFALGRVVLQRVDGSGRWLASEAREADAFTERVLREAARVAEALGTAGYFGPFGVDAFLYRGPDGARRLRPLSEINARYSMGFFAGMRRSE